MKKILLIITLLTGVQSQARSLMPHKPFRAAPMEVTQASGEFSNSDTVKLVEWSYPVQDKSQALRPGNLMVLEVNGKTTGLMISSVEDAGCGSKIAKAKTYSPNGQSNIGKDQTEIELLDHSTRICKDFQAYRWIADVTLSPFLMHRPLSRMNVVGNPKFVNNTQVLTADLDKKIIDPNVWFANDKLQEASIEVDLQRQILKLFISRGFYCPPGQMCPMVMPGPIIISLPITSIKKGECNVVIYSAKQDKRPVDGILEKLEVTDFREFYKHCRSYTAVPGVSVDYETKGYNRRESSQISTHSEFTGKRYLEPITQ